MKISKMNSRFTFFTVLLVFVLLLSCGKSVNGTPKLLDLGADKCIPCKEMAPILEELKEEYAGVLDVEFIDVWKPENQLEAEKYGITKIPTQIFFDAKGNELWRHIGFISKNNILEKWAELGYDLKPSKKPLNDTIIDDACGDCDSRETVGCGSSGC